jgi:hypothetical protein
MTRDEALLERNKLAQEVQRRRALGEYDANAGGVLQALESTLKLYQHILDRMKKV